MNATVVEPTPLVVSKLQERYHISLPLLWDVNQVTLLKIVWLQIERFVQFHFGDLTSRQMFPFWQIL